MSDLAPFLAAALRDKVILDLQEENQKLAAQLRQTRTVEITGWRGTPVYARAQFHENGSCNGNPNLWQVDFDEEELLCPLSDLSEVEVRVGGICKAVIMDNDEIIGSLVDGKNNTDDSNDDSMDADQFGRVARFRFMGCGQLSLTMAIHGWPEEHWRRELRNHVDTEGPELLMYLSEGLATEAPTNKTVSFSRVEFCVDAVKGLLQGVPLDSATDEAKERERVEEKERQLFRGAIAERMISAGYEATNPEDFGMEFQDMLTVLTVLTVLSDLGLREVGEFLQRTTDPLVQLQMHNRENEPDITTSGTLATDGDDENLDMDEE